LHLADKRRVESLTGIDLTAREFPFERIVFARRRALQQENVALLIVEDDFD
jgi:hypothetical protein